MTALHDIAQQRAPGQAALNEGENWPAPLATNHPKRKNTPAGNSLFYKISARTNRGTV